MSAEFAFLDELLSDLPSQTYDSKFPINEAINYVESTRKPTSKSELEVKLRKENARLRCYYKHYRKTLNEREARLTELLKEKLSMTEEQGRIENWKRKLEEANVHKEATEQLNKQLHELAKSFDNDKITLNNKIQTFQKKSRKLKKELNGKDQQLLQERKRRLKLLKIIVELSEILISVGLLPVKYKRSLDGWKFEVNLGEDGAEGDDDVEEKVEEEEPKVENSSPKSIAPVLESKSIEPPKVVSIVQRNEDPLAIMSDSDSSGDEGCKSSSSPVRNHPPSSALVVDSVKSLYKRLVSSKEDVLRVGSDFGSTVMSPCSSVSVGEQCGTGSSFVSKGPLGNQVLSPPTSSGGISVISDSGRTEKSVTLSSEEDDWHWDEFSEDLPPAGSSGVNQTDQETRSVSIDTNQEESKRSQVALVKSSDSSDILDVHVILKKMHLELPSLLQPFKMEDDAPHSGKSVTSNEWPCEDTPELADGAAVQVCVNETLKSGVDASPAVSCVASYSLSLTSNNRLSADRILCENTENDKGMSSAVNEVGAVITPDPVESLNSAIASPIKDLSRSEKKSKRRGSKKLAVNVTDSTYSSESCDDVPHAKKGEVSEVNEVSCVLSTTLSTVEGECGSKSEDKMNPVVWRSLRGRGRLQKVSGEELDGGNKSKGKKHSKKDVEGNTVKIKSPTNKRLSPIKEESPRRFSLRLRSNKPLSEGMCPNVNNNAEVPLEEDSESSLDNNPAGKLQKTKAKSQKPKKTLPLVDYSDTSDTCDSVLPTLQELEGSVSAEPVNVGENTAKVAAVDIRGPARSELVPVQIENDNGLLVRTQQGMNVLCNTNVEIPRTTEDRCIIPRARESSKSDKKYNELESQMDVGDSSSSGDVVFLSTVENSPAPTAPSECPSVKENGAFASQLVNNLSDNGLIFVADSEEVGGNPCHVEKDHGSDRSETESNATLSVFNPSDEFSQDGGMVNGLHSPFLFSSDESGDEYSDAVSVLDEDEDSSSISVICNASENGVNMSRGNLGKLDGTEPSLSDGISSMDKSLERTNPPASVTSDFISLPSNQKESVITPDSQKLKGVVLPKEHVRNYIPSKRSSLENNGNASKNILGDPKGVLNNSVVSEGNKTTEPVDPMAQPLKENPITAPLTYSVSNGLQKQENHSLDRTCNSVLMHEKAGGKSRKNSRLHNHDKKNMSQTETSITSVINRSTEKHGENPDKISPEGFNRSKNDIKNSKAPLKEPSGIQSMFSLGAGPLKKIISFFGENSSSRKAVPFLFKKLNLFQFPGVKFRLRGRLAPKFYPDPYSFPKRPLLSFKGCNFEEFYQMIRSMNADEKFEELQHPGVKFFKQGSFAPPHFTDLYLNPGRLAINFGNERRKTLKSHEVEDSPLKKAEGNGILSADCLPGYCSSGTNEVVDSDGSNTCNDSEKSYDSSSEISVGDDLPADPGDLDNDCMVMDQVSSSAVAKTFETIVQNVQVSLEEKLNADSGNRNDFSEKLKMDHQDEKTSSRLHERDQIPPGRCLASTSPVTSQKTPSVAASAILRDLTFSGEIASNAGHDEQITDKKSQTGKTEYHGRGEMVNNQEMENVDVTMSAKISSHESCDSIFVETNSRESFSSRGYSSDKEDSPCGSVVDGVVNHDGYAEERFLKESSNTNIQPNASAEVDPSRPSGSLNCAEDVTLRSNSHNDKSLVNDLQHTNIVTCTNYLEVDLRMAENGSRSHCLSSLGNWEGVTGGGVGTLGRNNHLTATPPSKVQGVDDIGVELKNEAASVSCKNSALPDGFTMERIKGQTTENENCVLTTDLECSTSVFKNEDHGVKLLEGKSVEKIDDGGLVGNVGIDNLIMAICPDGRIPEVTLKSDGANGGEIFRENYSHLLHMDLPLGIAPFSAKLGDEKRNFMNILTHVNGNKAKEPCKKRMEEEAGSKIGDGIFNNSFSDESAYSSMSKSALSRPDSVETAQIPSSQVADFNSREKASETMHIDKCLMAENLDDLIELAGGLHSFDDGCLGSDATEVFESVAEANILTKTSTTGNGDLGNENYVNQLSVVTDSYEDPVQNPKSLDNFPVMPTHSREAEAIPISSAELKGELKNDASNAEKDVSACDAPLTSDIQRRSALQGLVCHSGHDSGSSLSDLGQLHSAENCSVQSSVSHLSDKNSYDSTELAVTVNECKGETLVKAHSSDRELKNLVVGSGESLAVDGSGQSEGAVVVNGAIIEKFDRNNGSGPRKSPCSQSVCVKKNSLLVDVTNSATNASIAVEVVDANKLDLNGPALHTKPAVEGIAPGGMKTVGLKVLSCDKGDMDDHTPFAGRTPRENTQRVVQESVTSKVGVQGNGNDTILVMKPSPEENEISNNFALSPGKGQGSERTQISDQMKNVKMEDVIRVDFTKGHCLPKSPDCGLVSNVPLEEPESLNSSATLSNEKKEIVTKVAKKDLFGTDSSSDSEPLVNLLTRKRRKRTINIILSSESENECDKRRKVAENEMQHLPAKRPVVRTKRRKSVTPKCNIILESPVSPSDSVESPFENDSSICQPLLRDVKHQLSSGGNAEEIGKNSDKVGETNDGPYEVRADGSNSDANVDSKAFLADMVMSDRMKSEDNSQLMPSVNVMCKSHLPVLHVPSRPGAAPRAGTLRPRVYASKLSNSPKKIPSLQVTPQKVEEKDITLPDLSTDTKLIHIDDGLNATAIPSSPEEEKNFFKGIKKEMLPQGVGKMSESPCRRKTRKQSFVDSLKCDDAVILSMQDLKAMTAEPHRPKRIKTPKTKNKPESTDVLNEEGNGDIEKVCENGKGGESSEECISSIPQNSVAEVDKNMSDLQDTLKAAIVPDVIPVFSMERKDGAAKNGKKYYASEEDDNAKDSSISEDRKLKSPSAAKGDNSPVHSNTSNSHSGEKHGTTDSRSSEEQDDQPLQSEKDSEEAVAAGICKENKRAKTIEEASSSNESNEELILKDTSIPEDGEHHQPSEKFISYDAKKSPCSAQGGSLSVSYSPSDFLSNKNSDEVETGSGGELDAHPSRKGTPRVSRVSGKGKKMLAANSSPKITHTKEEVNEEERNYLEESRDVQPKKRVAHVPKTSPAVAEISPSSINKCFSKSNSEEKNDDEHENNDCNLPYKKKKCHSKVTAKVAKLVKNQGNENIPKTTSKEKKTEDVQNSKEQQSSLPLKKRVANFPNKSTCVTKPSSISPSNKMNSEAMDVDRNTALEEEDKSEPHFKNRITHAPKMTLQVDSSNVHPPVNKSLSDTGMNGNKKESADGLQQGYGPPSKKRIAHIPKGPAITKPNHGSSPNKNSSVSAEESSDNKESPGKNEPYRNPSAKKRVAHSPKTCPKSSNADNFDSSLSETESLPDLPRNQSHSTKSPASKVKMDTHTRPKAKVSKLSKLRTLVSRVKGYRPSAPSDASTSRILVHRGGGCCSKKNSSCRSDGDYMKKSCKSVEQPTRKSLRKKTEECGPSLKKRRTCAEVVVETPQPGKLKEDNKLKAGSPIGSLPDLHEGAVTAKYPQQETNIGEKPKSTEHIQQTPVVLLSPLKGEANPGSIKKDALSIGAIQEKMLEEMEVPPLSPLSDDAFVDALIEFPDSSESVSDVDIDQTPDFISTPKRDPKKADGVKCQPDSGKEVSITNDIEGKQEGTKVVAGKYLPVISSELIDSTGDTIECSKMVAKDYAPLLQGVNISFDTPDSIIGEYEVTAADSSTAVPSQIDATSLVDQTNADSHGNTVTPSQLREKLETISAEWHSSKDYFSKILTKIKEENAGKDPKKEFPYVSRDKRRILKGALKKMNGQYFGNNVLKEIVATIHDPSYGYRSKHIAKYLVRMLSKEDEDDVQSPVLRGAPRMTRFQMRALSLILALENRCPQFKDICSIIFRGIQFILFRLAHCPPVEVVKPLARMYTALSMAKRDIWRVRCFIYDALFAINTKAADLISVVLSMWHEVLPRQESSRETSHLESSIFMAISHLQVNKFGPNHVLQSMQHLKMILRNVYRSEHHNKTYDQFLEELLLAMRDGKNVNTLEPSIVLMAKKQGWEWTHKNLLCNNLVSIMGSWKGCKPSPPAAALAIKLIGLLSRSCPMETSGPVKNIIESLSHTLVKEPCDDPSIKEALVMSLICLARYHTYHVVRALDIWRPMREPPEEVIKSIKGFVLRDSMQEFWKKKYRAWNSGTSQRKTIPYFERSTPLVGSGVPLGENAEGGGDCSRGEGNGEVNSGGGKQWAPMGSRFKYKEWIKDKTNAESIEGEVKEWDRVAFSKSKKKKKKKKNKPKVSQT